MNRILWALLFALCGPVLCGQSPTVPASTCVILKRASSAVHAIQGIEFFYVEGQYPPGFNFMTNLRGRHVRKLVKLGGRMVIVEDGYTLVDLENARKQCAAPPERK